MNASGAGPHGWVQTNSAKLYRSDGGVCVRARSRMRVRACVRVRARACVMCLQYTIIIFDPG